MENIFCTSRNVKEKDVQKNMQFYILCLLSYGEKGVKIFFSFLHPTKCLKQRKWRKRIITA